MKRTWRIHRHPYFVWFPSVECLGSTSTREMKPTSNDIVPRQRLAHCNPCSRELQRHPNNASLSLKPWIILWGRFEIVSQTENCQVDTAGFKGQLTIIETGVSQTVFTRRILLTIRLYRHPYLPRNSFAGESDIPRDIISKNQNNYLRRSIALGRVERSISHDYWRAAWT